MATNFNYLERTTGDDSPFSIGFSMESGRSSILYYVNGIVSYQQIYNIVRELVGDVTTLPSYANLIRTLPVAHPLMPWYCNGVSSMKGVGGVFQQISNPFIPFKPEIQYWCLYNQYHISTDFGPRPYPVYSDQIIGDPIELTWFNSDGEEETFNYSREWERFVDIDIKPSSDTVSMQLGQMAFNCTGLPRNARPFMAQPKMFLNNEMLTLTWYCVPMSYYTSNNSYLRRFRGRVNQQIWATSSFGTYEPGELLYLGCTLKRFTPPLGNTTITFPGTNLTDFAKYVNIELSFSYTKRNPTEPARDVPTNRNYVVGGHNLQPYFGSGNDALSRTFLYASTVPTDGANSVPLWLSYPPHLLFTNPDFDNNVTF